MKIRDCPFECGTFDTYGTDWCVTQHFPAGGLGRCKLPQQGPVRPGKSPGGKSILVKKSFAN